MLFLAIEYAHIPPKMLQSNKEGCKKGAANW